MLSKYTHIIWDWNGTLLNDVEWCLKILNTLLSDRKLKPLKDVEAYKSIFGFPIIDYYRRAGFDFDEEPFEKIAAEFIERFHSDNSRFHLFEGAKETLAALKGLGFKQVLLSASEASSLQAQISLFDIKKLFP